jgi:hypothetical protein
MMNEIPVEEPSRDNRMTVRESPAGKAELAKALVLAQQKCKSVEKDSYNTFHRYRYASAEAILAQAKEALSETGLALLPLEQALNGYARDGEGRFELVRKFCLLHISGEWMPLSCAWPVVLEKGRPLDKATAIAATLSLSYLLRDLLLMPRVDADDDGASLPLPSSRPVGNPLPPERPTPAPLERPASSPEAQDHLAHRLDQLMRATGISAETLAGWLVSKFAVNHWSQLSVTQKQQVVAGLEARAVRAQAEVDRS